MDLGVARRTHPSVAPAGDATVIRVKGISEKLVPAMSEAGYFRVFFTGNFL